MPKAFSETERHRIRSRLLEAGKKILNRSGVRGLSVAEAAAGAGISKGSFYAFFPTREEFLMSVLEAWEQEFRGPLLEALVSGEGTLVQRWERFFRGAFTLLEREPGLASLAGKDVRMLLDRLPPERVAAHQEADRRVLEEAFGRLLAQGVLDPADAPAFPGVTAALFALVLSRDLFAPGTFGPAAGFLAEALALRFSRPRPDAGGAP